MLQIISNNLLAILRPLLLISPLVLLFFALESRALEYPELDEVQLEWLGEQIYNNECNQQIACLTAWNSGEDFPSLGIGHFIWYQEKQKEIYEESFPLLLAFLDAQSIIIPAWIVSEDYNSPWKDRQSFIEDLDKVQLKNLRQFLYTHMTEQTLFIVQRFEQALDKITFNSSNAEKTMLETRFFQVANTSSPYGLYALIDYVNFKGEGISALEQYQEQGWGLKQVLENMSGDKTDPLQQFIISAQQILEQRVSNSPENRNEMRWLKGWNNRLDTYSPSSLVE